jgi:hypothetical protein
MESPGNPNDAIRQHILRYFYDRNAQATSRFGKKGSAVKISDVKRELKAQAGLTQQQVMSNLTYLLDREWVKAIEQRKEVSTRGGTTVPSVVTFYEISAQGIERIEGESDFQTPERFAGINIQATGSNVITPRRRQHRQCRVPPTVPGSDRVAAADRGQRRTLGRGQARRRGRYRHAHGSAGEAESRRAGRRAALAAD